MATVWHYLSRRWLSLLQEVSLTKLGKKIAELEDRYANMSLEYSRHSSDNWNGGTYLLLSPSLTSLPQSDTNLSSCVLGSA